MSCDNKDMTSGQDEAAARAKYNPSGMLIVIQRDILLVAVGL